MNKARLKPGNIIALLLVSTVLLAGTTFATNCYKSKSCAYTQCNTQTGIKCSNALDAQDDAIGAADNSAAYEQNASGTECGTKLTRANDGTNCSSPTATCGGIIATTSESCPAVCPQS